MFSMKKQCMRKIFSELFLETIVWVGMTLYLIPKKAVLAKCF